MNLLSNISFKVISDTSISKLVYMFNRVFIRIGNKFLLYFFIALILAVLITFFYYKYISRLLKLEEKRMSKLLKRVFRRIMRKPVGLKKHEIFTKRQLKKIEERKKRFDIFKGKEFKKKKKEKAVSAKEVKKEKPVKKVEKMEEEGGYIMWPPKPKEKKVFDDLSKLK